MAGGKGTRLSSLTGGEIPKPMVRICGIPILEHQIITLSDNGIKDIIIIGGYLFDKISDYFENGEKWNVRIQYIKEEYPMGTAGALFYIKNIIKEDFLLVYGDIIFDIDIKRFVKLHQEKGAIVSLLAHPNAHPYDSDVIITDREDYVSCFLSKKSDREEYYKNLVNAGIYLISPAFLQYIEKPEKYDLEHNFIFTKCLEKDHVYVYRTPEYVKDVGTPERLFSTEKDIENGIVKVRNLRNKQKCIFLDRDGTINKHIGFLSNIKDMELEDTAAQAIKSINESGYLCIVITNQPVIARNECTTEELEMIHAKMETMLGEEGAYLDDILYCPHHPDKGYKNERKEYKVTCDCRKPKIGLIQRCMIRYNIDLSKSWMIGDTTRDIQTGINAGLKTIGVRTGEGCHDGKFDVTADEYAENILKAVERII